MFCFQKRCPQLIHHYFNGGTGGWFRSRGHQDSEHLSGSGAALFFWRARMVWFLIGFLCFDVFWWASEKFFLHIIRWQAIGERGWCISFSHFLAVSGCGLCGCTFWKVHTSSWNFLYFGLQDDDSHPPSRLNKPSPFRQTWLVYDRGTCCTLWQSKHWDGTSLTISHLVRWLSH